ncbi:hypothetical protein [Paenibacillus flagellatus]|uniref:rRNA biogenesis protein rrp5 n=1 Tax=Paenibacillus flagellatus TaxID=2211139 RepID=A0A2V5KNY1_9BACL|nr:hypothetical protein [Paenibacillus flagellatus]PYI57050.1 hypothetical protein DLM86_00965 [Paenibacillus flagellatus]
MSVQITINGGDAAEAVKELSALASHLVPAPGSIPAPAAAPDAKSTSAPDTDDADEDEEESESEKVPTVIELREKAAVIGKTAEGKKAVKALLTKYESNSLSEVPEKKRTAFLKELEKLAAEGNE